MKNAVRYYSRTGNTKVAAEAIAKAINEEAVSVDSPEAPVREHVDVLFIGGALYAYGIDKHLKNFVRDLRRKMSEKRLYFPHLGFQSMRLKF